MELHVFNSFTNRVVQQVPLDNGPVTVGRAADSIVRLESPFIAAKHAVLYARDGQYFIDSATTVNAVKVAGVEVARGDPIRVRPGDDIRLAEYFFYLVEPQAEEYYEEEQVDDAAGRALAFEESLHDRLLAALNLQTLSATDRRNAEFTTRVDRALLELIRERLPEIDPATGEYFIEAYLRRRIAGEIADAAEKRNLRGASPTATAAARDVFDRNFRGPASDIVEQTLSHTCGRMIRMLNLNLSRLGPGRKLARDKVLDDMHVLDEKFREVLPEVVAELPEGGREHMIAYMVGKDIHDVLFGLGPLEDLLRMPDVEEIMVLNENRIYVGKEGRIEATGRRFFSRRIVMSVIERIVGEVGRKIDFREPMVDARLPDGSRVNAIIPPVALSGPTLTIRRFPESRYTMDDLVSMGTLNASVAHFIAACVKGRRNMLISGGTGTGKTTLLNVLAGYIGRDERIVTIEDAAELNLPQRHVVTLEARPAGLEGTGAVTIDMLVRNALRMRPDRIIVGECRGAEAVDMLQAMNTGHDGSLSTVHANDAAEALQRIETMVLKAGLDLPSRAIREQIVGALEVVVHLTRRPDGRRAVTRVSEVAGIDPAGGHVILQDVFAWVEGGGEKPRLAHTGYIPMFARSLFERGLLKLEDLLNA